MRNMSYPMKLRTLKSPRTVCSACACVIVLCMYVCVNVCVCVCVCVCACVCVNPQLQSLKQVFVAWQNTPSTRTLE